MDSIVVEKLTKKFGDFTAVNGISFSVRSGELFGLLGPNGAGKTTTINMLSTLLEPTSGRGKVAGFDIHEKRDDVRKNIGIVFQEPALDGELTGRENLEFHAMMYGMDKKERRNKINEVLKIVELGDRADVVVNNYSGGMKRRLEIGRGLIHKPKVLFLDEPTLGLDAQTRRRIWEYIRKLRDFGVTIILTTHYMEEADSLCDRVAIIDRGKIVALDTPEKLKDMLGGDAISLEVGKRCSGFIKELEKQKWVKTVKKHDSTVTLTTETGEKKIPEIFRIAQKAKTEIESVKLHKPSLENVYLHFTGKTIREHELGQRDKNKAMMARRRRFHG